MWLDPTHLQSYNGQLADREEIFAESDKKCIGLELQNTPLTSNYLGSFSLI